MKRDAKKALLQMSVADLQKKIHEMTLELIRSRQERLLQDRSTVNVRAPYHTRKQIALMKAELSRRELEVTA